jgi:hypothetical protein
MGRGGTWASWKTKTAHWVKSGQIRFILQIGLNPHFPSELDIRCPEMEIML